MSRSLIVRPWPRLLTVQLTADYLGVSAGMVREWLQEGQLRPHALPGIRGRDRCEKVLFRREDLDRFAGLGGE